jgi:hypothetical protein
MIFLTPTVRSVTIYRIGIWVTGHMDVRTLCLGVLSLEDASGYEIKQTLEDVFGSFYNASAG